MIRLKVVVAKPAHGGSGGRASVSTSARTSAPDASKVDEGEQLWLAYEDCCLLGEIARNCCVNAGVDPDAHTVVVDGVRSVGDAELHSTTLQQAGVASGATVTLVPLGSRATGGGAKRVTI